MTRPHPESPAGRTSLAGRTHLCASCGGSGLERYNEARDPETGVWDCDERECWYCNGTGMLVATP